MIYRVVLKISYNEAYFDFEDIESAGRFARLILVHMVDSDDSRKKTSIRIEVINTENKESEDN